MNILIINPNSDIEMTNAIEKSAKEYLGERGTVKCVSPKNAPRFIDSYKDKMQVAEGMLEIVKNNEDKVDAFIVACHCDPNLDLLKESTDKVVVGIGEASMKLATMLGHSFSVISTDLHSTPNKEALVQSYNLERNLASIKTPRTEEVEKLDIKEKLTVLSKLAVEEDLAEVLVLGCAGYSGLDKDIQAKVGVPVLDGVICAMIIAEGFVNYKVSTSKIRRYNQEY